MEHFLGPVIQETQRERQITQTCGFIEHLKKIKKILCWHLRNYGLWRSGFQLNDANLDDITYPAPQK